MTGEDLGRCVTCGRKQCRKRSLEGGCNDWFNTYYWKRMYAYLERPPELRIGTMEYPGAKKGKK